MPDKYSTAKHQMMDLYIWGKLSDLERERVEMEWRMEISEGMYLISVLAAQSNGG